MAHARSGGVATRQEHGRVLGGTLTAAQIGTAALPAFLASLVEFVEALTIVLAVGITRGWRSAILGSTAAVGLLALLVLLFGPFLGLFPITWLQVTVGWLLILFGMRWLRKAILRAGGVVSLRDESKVFEEQKQDLRAENSADRTGLDLVAFLASFKAVVLEGLEVVFIVIALGVTSHALIPASAGAAVAGVLVVASGIVLHRPLSRVPENGLKFTVGILLSAFGTYWIGEGLGMEWAGKDLAILGLIAVYFAVSLLAIAICRKTQRESAAKVPLT